MQHVLTIDAGRGTTAAMLLAGLLDLGAPMPLVRQDVEQLGDGEVRMSWVRVQRGGSPALVVNVRAPQHTPVLTTPDEVQHHLADLDLDPATAELAATALEVLHLAEAAVTGTTPDDLALDLVPTMDHLAMAVAIASSVVRTRIDEAELTGSVLIGPHPLVGHLLADLPTTTTDRDTTDPLGAAWLVTLGAVPLGARGAPVAVGRGAASGTEHQDVVQLHLHPTEDDGP